VEVAPGRKPAERLGRILSNSAHRAALEDSRCRLKHGPL